METASTETTCYRHPRRETLLTCTRCERHICTDCLREAAVGYRCPDCVKSENRTMRQARTVFGGARVATPWATYALIGLNVAVYLLQLVFPGMVDRFVNWGEGLIGPDGQAYVADGGPFVGYELVGVLHGEWYRLFTSAFMHQSPGGNGLGIMHILLNMGWLWMLGRFLEERLGRVRYLAVYLIAAFGCSVLAVVIDPAQASLGASGAGFGLAAAYFVLTRKLHEYPIDRRQLLFMFLFWLVISAGFTSWEGHLGGLLAGAGAAFAIAYAPRERRALWQAVLLGALTVLVAGLLILKALQVNGVL